MAEQMTSRDDLKGLSTWMLLLDGAILVMLGAIVIMGVDNAAENQNLVRVFGGILCLAGGLLGVRLWVMTRDRELHPMLWLMSIVPIVLGIILLVWPSESLEALRAIIAIVLIVRGVIESSSALGRRKQPGWQFLLSHGVAAIVIGIMFWILPSLAVVLLILFMGIDLIMRGVMNISLARRLRERSSARG